jgi:hypothetical protein
MWIRAVRAAQLGAKIVERGQFAGWNDFEDRAAVLSTTVRGCPVEATMRAFY